MVRDRLIRLLRGDLSKIDQSRLVIIGHSDPLTYYTIFLSISCGFGFHNKVYWIKIDEDFSFYSIFDWWISSASSLEKLIKSKFPGAELEIIEAPVTGVYTLTKLLNPTILINTSRSEFVRDVLEGSFNDAISVYLYGDSYILCTNLGEKIPKELFYREGGHLGYVLGATYAASHAVAKVVSGKHQEYRASILWANNNSQEKFGRIIEYIGGVFVIGGAGAMANWFLECLLPYLFNNSRLYIIDGDRIEDHNVLRQQFYYVEDSGKIKAEVLSERLKKKAENLVKKIEVIPINSFIKEDTYEEIAQKILQKSGEEKRFAFSFIDNGEGMYYLLKLAKKIDAASLLAFGYSQKDFSHVVLCYGDPENILQRHKEKIDKNDTGRNPCLNPGSIVIPHGAGGSASVVLVLNGKPKEISLHLPRRKLEVNDLDLTMCQPYLLIEYSYLIDKYRRICSRVPVSLDKLLDYIENNLRIENGIIRNVNLENKKINCYLGKCLTDILYRRVQEAYFSSERYKLILEILHRSFYVILRLCREYAGRKFNLKNIYDMIYIALANYLLNPELRRYVPEQLYKISSEAPRLVKILGEYLKAVGQEEEIANEYDCFLILWKASSNLPPE